MLLFISSAVYAQTAPVIADKPPMGWNSYNCYGSAVHEDEVLSNAEYLAKNLRSHGWEYVVIDFLWSYDNPPLSHIGNPFQKNLSDGSYIPWLTMDQWGRLLPQPTKFPSAFNGNGFKPIADRIHSLGLKFGIHVMRGIPRQAVWAKTPVLGAPGITADMIADTTSKCTWMNHMYGLNMSKPGAQAYLNSILNLYASWGVDFIKVDDLSRPYSQAEVEGYHQAIRQCGRPIVFSTSPGETPISEAQNLHENANMWRIADDFWDNWKEILQMFAYAKRWEGIGEKGHWPDCDMLQIGKLSKRGPVGPERYSRLTDDELYTHMTFWSIYRSPLMLGGNQPENRELELKLITNDEVLQVNQNGENPRELYHKDGHLVWFSHRQNSKAIFVALFNLNQQPENVSIDLRQLGMKGGVRIRDLWQHQGKGQYKGSYQQQVNAHGAVLLMLEPEK